jgi:hypothetical protein
MLYLQLRLISVANVNGQGLWHVVAVTHLNEDGPFLSYKRQMETGCDDTLSSDIARNTFNCDCLHLKSE